MDHKRRIARLSIVIVLALAVLGLAGCGGGDGQKRGTTNVSGSLISVSAAKPGVETPAAGEVNVYRGEELVETVQVADGAQGKFNVQLTPSTYSFRGTLPNADCKEVSALITPNGSGAPVVIRCQLP